MNTNSHSSSDAEGWIDSTRQRNSSCAEIMRWGIRTRTVVLLVIGLGCSTAFGQASPIRNDASWGRTAQDVPGVSAPPGGVVVGSKTYNISGNVYTIAQSDGKVAGSNLFHSFERFSILSGDATVFQAQIGDGNVISRVSGSTPTSINGLLAVSATDGGKPNFFFINPNGVTFGAGTQIDVPASFHVSTANNLRFKDDQGSITLFSAGNGPDNTFTSAAPEAFGFLGGNGTIAFGGVRAHGAEASPGFAALSLDVSASSVDFNNSYVFVPESRVHVVAVGTNPRSLSLSGLLDGLANGDVTLTDSALVTQGAGSEISIDAGQIVARGSQIDHNDDTFDNRAERSSGVSKTLSGTNGGSISLNADRILFTDSALRTDTKDQVGGTIVISARETAELNESEITSTTRSAGSAGSIRISGGSISLTNDKFSSNKGGDDDAILST